MSHTPNLTEIFGQFVGKTLLNPMRMTDDDDMTISDMQEAAANNGLTLRIKFPGYKLGTKPIENLVIAHTEQEDGNIVIKSFKLG